MDAAGTAGPWKFGGIQTNSRQIRIGSLSPGKMYLHQTRAIGGSTGFSEWSDPLSYRAM